MRILGSIIWFFLGGWILAILTYLSGLVLNHFSRDRSRGLRSYGIRQILIFILYARYGAQK